MNSIIKKISLSLGAATIISIPIVGVISCGSGKEADKIEQEKMSSITLLMVQDAINLKFKGTTPTVGTEFKTAFTFVKPSLMDGTITDVNVAILVYQGGGAGAMKVGISKAPLNAPGPYDVTFTP